MQSLCKKLQVGHFVSLYSILTMLNCYRNDLVKRVYPARGSFICHWAKDHGKVIDAMKSDTKVNMTEVLSLLGGQDERMRGFIEQGTSTGYDKSPVKILKLSTGSQSNTKVQQNKELIKCPKCSKFDKNKCKNSLKLHLFHHYLDFWKDKIPQFSSKSTLCEQCSPPKKLVGANADGLRVAMICHLAIQHGELREALITDSSLPREFIGNLYSDIAPAKVLEVTQVPISSLTMVHTDVTCERERILQEVRKRQLHKSFEVGEQSSQKKQKINSSKNQPTA